MTRILQVRRGSAAQNDNFTGMAGEITMDTTNKTLRIHDGETLGGFALARADAVPNAFDINSISSDFWTALFSTYQTNSIQIENSNLQPLTSTPYIDCTMEYNQIPKTAEAILVCQSPEAGYSIDDEVRAFGIGNYSNPHVNTYVSNDALHVRLYVNEQTFWVFHKTDATPTNITNANWKIKFTVCY
ncbi:MAG: hypothetical protein II843_03925 [Alphaproteobacteria bacterium]|nr:hypothetical protein [Alphaproteobacteria bacterium]MBQ6012123.1 hypothetical protein [Alphaproteobacteria bacterium]